MQLAKDETLAVGHRPREGILLAQIGRCIVRVQHNIPSAPSHVRNGANRVVLAADRLLPVYPQEQTFAPSEDMSQMGQRADTRRAGLAGWLRVTAAAISFPAAWSALSRRSLGDRGTPSPGNQSTSQTHSAPVDLQEIEDRGRDLVVLNIASA